MQIVRKDGWFSIEILFPVYYFMFTFTRPITSIYVQYSTYILFILASLLLIIFFATIRTIRLRSFKNAISIVCIILSIYFFDFVFRNNRMVIVYLFDFFIYGVIPLILLININDYERLLKYWCYLAIIAGALVIFDPFFNYHWTDNYMSYGFEILPSFCGSLIIYGYYKKRVYLFLSIIFITMIAIFANKGAMITATVFITGYFLGFKRAKSSFQKLLFFLVIFFVLLFSSELITTLTDIIASYSITSYSLTTYKILLSENFRSVLNSRLSIWNKAIELFIKKPIFGYGIGYFDVNFNGYAHNVFLDILVSSGFIVFVFFIIVLIRSIYKWYKNRNDQPFSLFIFTIFILWIVPMQFSLSLWRVIPFWAFFEIVYLYQKKDRYENNLSKL